MASGVFAGLSGNPTTIVVDLSDSGDELPQAPTAVAAGNGDGNNNHNNSNSNSVTNSNNIDEQTTNKNASSSNNKDNNYNDNKMSNSSSTSSCSSNNSQMKPSPETITESTATLCAAIGVSEVRAKDLLEAVSWDIARAADLHFSQDTSPIVPPQKTGGALTGSSPATSLPKRRRTNGQGSSGGNSLASFFAPSSSSSSSCSGPVSKQVEAASAAPASTPLASVSAPAASQEATIQVSSTTAKVQIGSIDRDHTPATAGTAEVQYEVLTKAFAKMCSTTKRKEKNAALLEAFREILAKSPSSLIPAVYLCSNKLGPPWVDLELGVGGSAISSAIKSATGASAGELSALFRKSGDPGDAAAAIRAKQMLLTRPAPLTINRVYNSLLQLCTMKGEGCNQRRIGLMSGLIRASRDADETRFLVRTFASHIRTQATLTTVKDVAVVAIMEHLAKKAGTSASLPSEASLAAAQKLAREQFTACPDVRRVLESLLEGGLEGMAKACVFTVGAPMRPMLAKPETSIEAVLACVGSERLACEHKYDGQRAQIHRNTEGVVTIFSRHLEDMTKKYPDVILAISEVAIRPDGSKIPFVVDAEIVAVGGDQKPKGKTTEAASTAGPAGGGGGETSDLRSDAFQRLSTRKRKDVTVDNIEVAVKVFAFDLLYFDADTTVSLPFEQRRRMLHANFPSSQAFGFAEYTDIEPSCGATSKEAPSDDVGRRQRIQDALNKALADNCEGLMCKVLSAPYEPSDGSKRSSAWIKLKADYIDGMGDSLDLVPIGGWQGMGRKSKWISPFLLACWDPDSQTLQSVCRVMTGFTDSFYGEKTKFYLGSLADEFERDAGAENDDLDEDDMEVDDMEMEEDEHEEEEDNLDGDEKELPAGAEAGKKKNRLLESTLARARATPDGRIQTDEAPPFWFKPCEVWEIKGASLSLSPKHKGAVGFVHPDRGISLRFPRFIRIRTDKSLEDATTSAQLAEMFRKQAAGGRATAIADAEDEDMQNED